VSARIGIARDGEAGMGLDGIGSGVLAREGEAGKAWGGRACRVAARHGRLEKGADAGNRVGAHLFQPREFFAKFAIWRR
jgi:hypothetical protein